VRAATSNQPRREPCPPPGTWERSVGIRSAAAGRAPVRRGAARRLGRGRRRLATASTGGQEGAVGRAQGCGRWSRIASGGAGLGDAEAADQLDVPGVDQGGQIGGQLAPGARRPRRCPCRPAAVGWPSAPPTRPQSPGPAVGAWPGRAGWSQPNARPRPPSSDRHTGRGRDPARRAAHRRSGRRRRARPGWAVPRRPAGWAGSRSPRRRSPPGPADRGVGHGRRGPEPGRGAGRGPGCGPCRGPGGRPRPPWCASGCGPPGPGGRPEAPDTARP
jgi:hypothetical protein